MSQIKSHTNDFSEQCLKCDLRVDVKQKVSYAVLGIIIAIISSIAAFSYRELDEKVDEIKVDIKEFTKAMQLCQDRTSKLEFEKNINERRLDKIEEAHKEFEKAIRSQRKLYWYDSRKKW